MDTQTILMWQRDAVAKLISDSGFSVARVSKETGIPHTTLLRKIKGVSEFKPSELFAIARVIHVDPSRMIPPIFNQAVAA